MNEVGFAYGRLREKNKNWVTDEARLGKTRIQAPGPVMNKILNEEDQQEGEFIDNFQTKAMAGFQKVKIPPLQRNTSIKNSRIRGRTTQPTGRMSASQRQAREYLNYLNSLNSNEHSYINSTVAQKTKELESKFESEAKVLEDSLNTRGIFSAEINKERVFSMLPVKMQSQIKITIQPIFRKAKDIVMKEKAKEWHFSPFDTSKVEAADSSKSIKKSRLLDVVERTISKQAMKKKEANIIHPTKQKVKLNWVDRLNNTVNEAMIKCTPDERISNMKVL